MPRQRGPGRVRTKPKWLGFYRAVGVADVKFMSKFDDGRYIEDGIWQPTVVRVAWGRSEASALNRCKGKLCKAVKHDENLEQKKKEASELRKKQTTTFENPCK